MEKEKTTKDLLDFEWDNDNDFFTKEVEEVEKKEDVKNEKNIEKETDKEKVIEKEKTEPEQEEEVVFDFESENDDIKTDDEKTNKYYQMAQQLKDAGILVEDIDIENVKNNDDILSLHDTTISLKVEKELERFSEDVGSEGKLFINYIKEGGKPKDFFKVLQETTTIPLYDENSELQNEKVIGYYLKYVKDITDEDDIADTVEMLKEKGTLDKYAEKYSIQLEKIKNKKESEQLEQIKKDKEIAIKNKKAFEDNISKFIDDTTELNNIKFEDVEKEDLKKYIFKPNKKKDGNVYISKFSEDLQNIFKEPEKLIILAKIMKSGFDLNDIVKDIETKITKDTKKKINTYTKPKTNVNKSLADFF